jgi:flagellar biogenesis protein FliO
MSALSTPELIDVLDKATAFSRPKGRIGVSRAMGAALVLLTVAGTAATVTAADAKRKRSSRASNRSPRVDAKNREIATVCESMPKAQPSPAQAVEAVDAITTPLPQPESNSSEITSFEAIPMMSEFSNTLNYCASVANEINQTTQLMTTSCEPAGVREEIYPAAAAEKPLPATQGETEFNSEVAADEPAGPQTEKSMNTLMRMWNWIQQKFSVQRTRKRLRVCESVSLGEKRFVAVIQVDGEQFLVGGSSNSVSTLARLDRKNFADVYRACEQDLSRA